MKIYTIYNVFITFFAHCFNLCFQNEKNDQTEEDKEVGRSVERMFRHSYFHVLQKLNLFSSTKYKFDMFWNIFCDLCRLAKSDALKSFFSDELTADKIVKRIAVNFRMQDQASRSAGTFHKNKIQRIETMQIVM